MTSPSKARMVPADQPEPYDHEPCCDHRASEYGHCSDCLDTGHAHAPDARPAASSAPATPAVGVGTSGGATGAPAGAGEVGLGDALRHIATGLRENVLGGWDLTRLADRADALEAQVERVRALFENGPDTQCRTTWPNGLECVEVPLSALRTALDGAL